MRIRSVLAALAITASALALAGCSTSPSPTSGAAVGTWSSSESGSPHLVFREDSSYIGSDGCNALSGSYTESDGTLTLKPNTTTLKGCMGVDTWLFNAATVSVSDRTLTVFSADGTEIGVLDLDN